jgi:hypothetical protein
LEFPLTIRYVACNRCGKELEVQPDRTAEESVRALKEELTQLSVRFDQLVLDAQWHRQGGIPKFEHERREKKAKSLAGRICAIVGTFLIIALNTYNAYKLGWLDDWAVILGIFLIFSLFWYWGRQGRARRLKEFQDYLKRRDRLANPSPRGE